MDKTWRMWVGGVFLLLTSTTAVFAQNPMPPADLTLTSGTAKCTHQATLRDNVPAWPTAAVISQSAGRFGEGQSNLGWGNSSHEFAETVDSKAAPVDFEKEFDQRLKELEAQLGDQQKSQKQAEEAAAGKPTFKINGRIHLDYWSFPSNEPGIGFLEHPVPVAANFGEDPKDRFQFRRIRLEASGDIPQHMLWRLQVDFNNPASPAYKDVFLGWTDEPGEHTLLLGNQKRPLGLDALDSSRFTVFMERPLINEAFVEDSRRVGACYYSVSEDQSLNWQCGLFNLENTSTSGGFVGDASQLGGYGRLAATPWYDTASSDRNYYHWAVAGAIASPDGNASPIATNVNEARFRARPQAQTDSRWLDTGRIAGAEWYEVLGTESRLNVGSFQMTSEAMVNFTQRDNTTPGTGSDLFFYGFYVCGSYFLTGEALPIDRRAGTLARVKPFHNFYLFDRQRGDVARGWGAWQLAARYDYLDLTDQDIAGGVQQNFTLGLNWHWNAYARMQSNLIFGDIRERGPINGFDGGNFVIWGTRWMCDF